MLGVASAAGLAIGYLLVPRAPVDDKDEAPPAVQLLGKPLPLDDRAAQRALERVRGYAGKPLTLSLPDGRAHRLQPGRVGVEIDRVRLAQLVRDAKDRTSPLRRGHRRGHAGANQAKRGAIKLPVPLTLDAESVLPVLLRLKDELDRHPSDARLNLEKRQIVPEVIGRLLDVDASVENIQRALTAGASTAAVAFETVTPERTAAQLKGITFEQVLGEFDTPYDRSNRAKARTYNLRLAASKFDGYVLMPGQTFDFNDVVGPRDEANGYKVATVIAEGELVDGIGGGTCQVSGTLHGAAFFAGLDIVERYPHTRPSSYIKMGLDATVVYPTINFRIRNNYKFPVVLHETVKSGRVVAQILGPDRTKTVTLIRRILAATPYQEVERPDKTLPDGMRVLAQRGVPGFRVRRYRIIREGNHAIRERFRDTYPPTAQIVRTGTGDMPRDKVRARDDGHPEYLADELLIATQGPGIDEMKTKRKPGKYGKAGWTETAGMPFWRRDE